MITLQEALAQEVATNTDGKPEKDDLLSAMSKLLVLLLKEHLNIEVEEPKHKLEFYPSP